MESETCGDHLCGEDKVSNRCEMEKEKACTVKVGIGSINLMIDSFLMAEKLIAFREFGQNVVN